MACMCCSTHPLQTHFINTPPASVSDHKPSQIRRAHAKLSWSVLDQIGVPSPPEYVDNFASLLPRRGKRELGRQPPCGSATASFYTAETVLRIFSCSCCCPLFRHHFLTEHLPPDSPSLGSTRQLVVGPKVKSSFMRVASQIIGRRTTCSAQGHHHLNIFVTNSSLHRPMHGSS